MQVIILLLHTDQLTLQQLVKFLIPASQIELHEAVGQGITDVSLFIIIDLTGEFGIVYRGLISTDDMPQVVAIKTLKGVIYNYCSILYGCIDCLIYNPSTLLYFCAVIALIQYR